MFSLSVSRDKGDAKVDQIFMGFNNFSQALTAYLMMVVYVVLWTLLLIIPGIIAALSYSMIFYIMADNPAMIAGDVLRKSKEMMNGYKLKLFYLYLRFFL